MPESALGLKSGSIHLPDLSNDAIFRICSNEPVGVLSWSGIASTGLWIDPHERLIGIYMTQVQPFDPTLGSRFRELAYAALETS